MSEALSTSSAISTHPTLPPLDSSSERYSQPDDKESEVASILNKNESTAEELVHVYNLLTLHSSDDLGYNGRIDARCRRIRFRAQCIINKCDEESYPAYLLFRDSGLMVTWPNIFKRIMYKIERIRRTRFYTEKLIVQKLKAEQHAIKAKNEHLKLSLRNKEIVLRAAEARYNAKYKTAEARILALKLKENQRQVLQHEKDRKTRNGIKIAELYESIRERKKEGRSKEKTNDIIREYNALIEKGDHDLPPSEWKKMEYISLPS